MLSCCERSEEATRGMTVHWLLAGIEKKRGSLIRRWTYLPGAWICLSTVARPFCSAWMRFCTASLALSSRSATASGLRRMSTLVTASKDAKGQSHVGGEPTGEVVWCGGKPAFKKVQLYTRGLPTCAVCEGHFDHHAALPVTRQATLDAGIRGGYCTYTKPRVW